MRVLYIENNLQLVEQLRPTLTAANHQLIHAPSVEQALSMLQMECVDLILYETNAQNVSKIKMLLAAKNSTKTAVPVITIVAAGDERTAVEASILGASDYLVRDKALVYLQLMPIVIKQVMRERQLTVAHTTDQETLRMEKEGTRMLATFIETASHEFRTPLSIINTSSYLLEKLADTPKQQEYVQHIQEQVETILHLINRLIKITRLDNIHTFTFMPMELNSLINDILYTKQSQIRDKNIHLSIELPPTATYLMGNPDEISDALNELIDNACKFSEVNASVDIQLTRRDTSIDITIRDTGIGMSADEISHAFQRLYRTDKNHSTQGFGLGLPIAARVIDIHHGAIKVESEPGKGTAVTVKLPMPIGA